MLADDPAVRVQALEALGANDTPDARLVVRRVIDQDTDPAVKYAATLSLIELSGAACLGELAADLRPALVFKPRGAVG